jgi:hypothetical protein
MRAVVGDSFAVRLDRLQNALHESSEEGARDGTSGKIAHDRSLGLEMKQDQNPV